LWLLIGHQLVSQVASRLLPRAMITEDCFSQAHCGRVYLLFCFVHRGA
jgi:hypothetical protein